MKLTLIICCECNATTELSLIILNGHNIKFDQCTGTRLLIMLLILLTLSTSEKLSLRTFYFVL